MWIYDWWWDKQGQYGLGTTLLTLMFSIDKTQLTMFSGDKKAYPIYILLGNILAHLHQWEGLGIYILVGYLPIHTPNGLVGTKDEMKQYCWAMFHTSVKILMCEIYEVINQGGWDLLCGDRYKQYCTLSIGSYTTDFSEQYTVVCIDCEHCPKCKASNLSDNSVGEDRHPQKTLEEINIVFNIPSIRDTKAHLLANSLWLIGYLFWEGIFDPYHTLTPNLLYQIWQGLIKLLTEIVEDLLGP